MKIYFSQNTKISNSTKLIECASEFDCYIHGSFDPVSPTVKLHGSSPEQIGATNYYKFAYAYIPNMKRYYFVSGWSYDQGIWTCSLVCDVVASYRDDVLNADVFINRAEYGSDDEVDDIPLEKTFTTRSVSSAGWSGIASYIVGIYDGNPEGNETNCVGSIKYFQFTTGTSIKNLQKALWSNQGLTETTGVNKANYIASARIIPQWSAGQTMTVNGVPVETKEANDTIFFGNVSSGVAAIAFDPTTQIELTPVSFTLPKHPGNRWWLNKSPYTSMTLYHPVFGTCNIPCEPLVNASTITVTGKGDPITGSGEIEILCDGKLISTMTGTIYPTITLSSQTSTLSTVAGDAVGGVAQIAEGVGEVVADAVSASNNPVGQFFNWFKWALGSSWSQLKNNSANGTTGNAKIDAGVQSLVNSADNSSSIGGVIQAIKNVGLSINGFKVGGVPQMNNAGGLDGVGLLFNPFTLTAFFAGVRFPGGLFGKPVRAMGKLKNYLLYDTEGNPIQNMVQPTGAHLAPKNATSNEVTTLNNILGGMVFVE